MAERFKVYYLRDKNPANLSADNRSPLGVDTSKWEIEPTVGAVLEINFALDDQQVGIVHYQIVKIESGVPGKLILCEIARGK